MRSGDVILVVDIHIVMSFICQKWDQSVQMCFFSLKTENKVKTRVCKQKRCRFIWKKENIRSEEIRRNITTRKIPSDREHYPLSPFSSSRMEEPSCSTFGDVSLLSSEIGNVDFDIYLMLIHLESLIEVLAFRFKISAGYASISVFIILTCQVILIQLEGLGTVLSDGFIDHETLKLSTKFAALAKVITLSRSLLFV